MNLFEYRQTQDLQTLSKTATCGTHIVRNQEIYLKYQIYRQLGFKKMQAVREIRDRYFRYLNCRTIFNVIIELETEI